MAMVDDIKAICLAANDDYTFQYEESKMMNVKVDAKTATAKFIYLEEIKRGEYHKDRFFWTKTTTVNLFFSNFVTLQADADTRETLRNSIETEVVIPFMTKYAAAKGQSPVKSFKFVTPPSQFDGNEVSIVLQFDVIETICI